MPKTFVFRAALVAAGILSSLVATTARATVYGLDVYAGNGTMNWPLIAGGGKDFSWVKATEGTYYQDANLGTNETNGTAAGMLIGCYDFAQPASYSPTTEADYFINFASSKGAFAAGKLAPALDLETGLGGAVVGASSLSAWAQAWCNEVIAKTGAHPVIYCNQNYASNLTSAVISNPLWVASYDHNSNPATGPWASATFIQYTSTGRLPGGPSGNVDLDYFNGSLSNLVANYAIGGVAPAAMTVPEPTSAALLASAALFLSRRRRRGRASW
jgi:GH25 family lysozyme M1 (1,4-beta-N-acetylmuramidase)